MAIGTKVAPACVSLFVDGLERQLISGAQVKP